MRNKNVIVAIAVVLIAAMFIGEAAMYFKNPYSYEADVTWEGEDLEYTLKSSNNIVYDLTVIDNGGTSPVNELIIYCEDENSFVNLEKELSVRGFHNVIMTDSKNLEDFMNEPEGKALLIPHGKFPIEIYNGNSTDPLMNWFDGGGSVYWFGFSPLNGYGNESYLTPLGLTEDDFCTKENYSATPSGMLCKPLSLRNSLVYNGLKADAGTPLAYVSDDGYSSITSKKVSNGSLIVFGGGHTCENSIDCAQLISAGVTADSVLLEHKSGTIKGTATKYIELDTDEEIIPDNISVYVCMGGYYTVYGKRF